MIAFNTADTSDGGGIYNDPFASLQVVASEVTANNLLQGGGVSNGVGGQVQVFGGSEIFLNNASVTGGGLISKGSSVAIWNYSLVYDNDADFGGGVAISGGTTTISGGGVYGNTASQHKGGGIYITSGNLTLTNRVGCSLMLELGLGECGEERPSPLGCLRRMWFPQSIT